VVAAQHPNQCLTVAQAQECSIWDMQLQGVGLQPSVAGKGSVAGDKKVAPGRVVCVLNCGLPTHPRAGSQGLHCWVWLLAHHQPDRSCCSDKARKAHPKLEQMPLPHPYQVEGGALVQLMLIQRKKKEKILAVMAKVSSDSRARSQGRSVAQLGFLQLAAGGRGRQSGVSCPGGEAHGVPPCAGCHGAGAGTRSEHSAPRTYV
jgi:hypothetical protein